MYHHLRDDEPYMDAVRAYRAIHTDVGLREALAIAKQQRFQDRLVVLAAVVERGDNDDLRTAVLDLLTLLRERG